jgi:hypothetical protein
MIDKQDREELPIDHVIARRALAGFVITLVAAAVIFVALRGPAELAAGRAAWATVRSWTVPW